MDARRFDDRTRRESDLRNLAIVLGGLLVLLVGAGVFLIFSLGSPPAPVSAVASGTPMSLVTPSALATSLAGSPGPSLGTVPPPPLATASQPPATTLPTAVPPTASPTPTATPRPPLVGDESSDALTITSLPFSQSLDVRRATESSADPRCDDQGDSADTVWFKYTTTSDDDLGAYTAGSNYGTILVVNRLNADGSTETIDCNVWSALDGSAVRLDAKTGVTYLFMVGALGRRGGELNFALDHAPKPASLEATLSPIGFFNSFGWVDLTVTTNCTGDLQYAEVNIELRQVVDREVHTMYGYWDFSSCRREQTWTLTLTSDEYAFGNEPTTANVSISYADRFENYWSESSVLMTLYQNGGPSPTPYLSPAY